MQIANAWVMKVPGKSKWHIFTIDRATYAGSVTFEPNSNQAEDGKCYLSSSRALPFPTLPSAAEFTVKYGCPMGDRDVINAG